MFTPVIAISIARAIVILSYWGNRNRYRPRKNYSIQESIPVGCLQPAWKPYVFQFQFPQLDVSSRGGYHH